MKEALVSKGPKVLIVDSPIPTPAADQVLIKVVVSGSNPKDWKLPEWRDSTANEGDDISGVVVRVGEGVSEFKPGDHVAAFHEIAKPHGSYAEYALAWQWTTFHIPESVSFEEASTIPLVTFTAVISMYADLGLPQPWTPAKESIPFIVYGASSSVGAAAVQLAKLSNIHPIIAVAGQSQTFVSTLIDPSKGDIVVDYRGGDQAAVSALKKAVGGLKVYHCLDAISEGSSNYIVSEALHDGGIISTVLQWSNDGRIKSTVNHVQSSVGQVHGGFKDLGFVFSRYLTRILQRGAFKPHPYRIIPGGLAGIESALTDLRAGKAHGFKYVFRIGETEGAGQDTL